jgi:NTP pyrophosphatase (non-canonical NTP hydrolase)
MTPYGISEDYLSSGRYADDVHRNLRSGTIYGDELAAQRVGNHFASAAIAAERLDEAKKALFYGKSMPARLGDEPDSPSAATVGDVLNSTKTDVDLFHGALGLVTESGEIAEVFRDLLLRRQRIDTVNLREEIGDCLWYLSVMAKALGTTLEKCAEVNTAKLRKRYPDNFTEDAAINRDIAAEREVLEADPREEVFTSGSCLDS